MMESASSVASLPIDQLRGTLKLRHLQVAFCQIFGSGDVSCGTAEIVCTFFVVSGPTALLDKTVGVRFTRRKEGESKAGYMVLSEIDATITLWLDAQAFALLGNL